MQCMQRFKRLDATRQQLSEGSGLHAAEDSTLTRLCQAKQNLLWAAQHRGAESRSTRDSTWHSSSTTPLLKSPRQCMHEFIHRPLGIPLDMG